MTTAPRIDAKAIAAAGERSAAKARAAVKAIAEGLAKAQLTYAGICPVCSYYFRVRGAAIVAALEALDLTTSERVDRFIGFREGVHRRHLEGLSLRWWSA